jgi:hypothetical protein
VEEAEANPWNVISPKDLMKVVREGQVVCFDVKSYESSNRVHVPG